MGPQMPPERATERAWALTGLFLFAVGLFGVYYRDTARYLSFWGVFPVLMFYRTLLVGGAFAMLLATPRSPFYWHLQAPTGAWGWALLLLRRVLSVAAVAFLLLVTVIWN